MSSITSNVVYVPPKPKEGVTLCMDVNEYTQNDILLPNFQKNMYHVKCPNCIAKGVKKPEVRTVYLSSSLMLKLKTLNTHDSGVEYTKGQRLAESMDSLCRMCSR